VTLVNDVARALLVTAIPWAAPLARWRFMNRIEAFDRDQEALRRQYGVKADTPIRGYDDVTRAAVLAFAASRPEVRLARTSGSTAEPKQLAYPPERLRSFKADSRVVGLLAWQRHRLRSPAIFVLSSLANDDSFTSLAVYAPKRPSWVTGLIEPARYLFQPALQERIARYGATAVRFWLFVLSDPGLVYSTNPSTLAVFLTEVHDEWARTTAMVRDWVAGAPAAVDRGTRDIASRVSAGDADRRLADVAAAASPLPVERWAPSLGAYCCWDGGYVVAFLRQIHRWLPPERYAHVPMYAMSTETIETLTWFDDDGVARFLPLGPGVLYEFLPDGAPDAPEHLVGARALEPGRDYTLVVSDGYGLCRYQTEDVFRCRALVEGLPDLAFQRRRGLTWSFTGEKLTGEHLSLVYAELEAEFPSLAASQLTTLPSWPPGAEVPGYVLVVAHPGRHGTPSPDGLGAAFDAHLARVNDEYAAKRSSARLAAPVARGVPYDRLAAALVAETGARSWDSQFKLAPLTRRLWEEVGATLESG
jgi:hypothetical protein